MNIKSKMVAALALAVFVLPGITLAQTLPSGPASNASLQAQIQALLAQVQQLQSQLSAQGGGTTASGIPTPSAPAAWCYTFNTNLSIGMSGSAVAKLQTALQEDGESVVVNGTFDDRTAAAVTAFQEKYQSVILTPYGLSNGTGYAGKATRAELNSLFGCGGSNPITPTSSSPIACPMIMPYCQYGGHGVMESNGCSELICNQGPITITTPVITGVNSAGAPPTPGSNEFLVGTNLPTANATIVIDPGSTSAMAIMPSYYNVGGGGNITFYLPSSIKAGSHTIEIQTGGVISNVFAFSVVGQSTPTSTLPSATGAVTVTQDSSNPPVQQLVMGSSGDVLAVYRLTETTGVENAKITSLSLMDGASSPAGAPKVSFTNVQVYSAGTLLGAATLTGTSNGGYDYNYTVNFTTPVIVPAGGSVSLTLKGDVLPYISGGATDLSAHLFDVTGGTAIGASSNMPFQLTLGTSLCAKGSPPPGACANGNIVMVYRTNIAVVAAPIGTTSGRGQGISDTIGSLTVITNSSGNAVLDSVKVTFAGSAASGIPSNVALVDPSTGLSINGQVIPTGNVSSEAALFTPNTVLSAGTAKTYNIRIDSSHFPSGATLAASIADISGVTFADGTDAQAGTGLFLAASAVPIAINSVQYGSNSTISVPTATLSANPTTITAGQGTVLTWSSTGATSCTLTGNGGYNDNGPWSQSGLATSGSKSVIPYPSSTVAYTAQYAITCYGSGGTGNPAPVGVTVNPAVVAVAPSYNGTVNISLDRSSPTGAVPPGAPRVLFANMDITATNGPVNLQFLSLVTNSANAVSGLSNFALYNGATIVGSTTVAMTSNPSVPGGYVNISFTSPIVLASGQSMTLALVADIGASATGTLNLGIGGGGGNYAAWGPNASVYGNSLTVSNDVGLANPNSSQTAIASQSLQSLLDQLAALLKSL